MSELRDRRRARRVKSRNRILVVVGVLLAFGLGIALGQALHDNPRPGGEQTSLRTVPPLTTQNP
ncbi:MAG TPA: hypothetical protein VNT04_06945 [Gaiellaceae bacterium]|nr:hypothetical protein [Gaiellaceae bacterium]